MKKIVPVLAGVLGFVGGTFLIGNLISTTSKEWKKMSDKNLSHMLLFNQWMIVKQSGKNLKDYFEKKQYKRIVVYGMSHGGERLIDELKNTGIEVVAGVDKNAKAIFADVPVLSPEDIIPNADCMVVTPVFFFDEIVEQMSHKVSYPIISLEDILYEV